MKRYKYCGASFNFDFMNDILSAMHNILEMGELIFCYEKKEINKFALFDLGVVDKIHSLLRTIKENPAEEINAWRLSKQQTLDLEVLIGRIFNRVKNAHDLHQDNVSRVISQKIVTIWKEFKNVDSSNSPVHSKFVVKTNLSGDRRLTEFSDLSFELLKENLFRIYNKVNFLHFFFFIFYIFILRFFFFFKFFFTFLFYFYIFFF